VLVQLLDVPVCFVSLTPKKLEENIVEKKFLHISFVNCDLSYTPENIVTRIIILNMEE
jgi:hypothetical protein